MSRLLIAADGQWYDELKAVAYYSEGDLEAWIHQHAASVFPHHYVFPFKKDITSRITAEVKRPDLALITHNLRSWSVVEVEIEGHTVQHTIDQMTVFANGDYNAPQLAEYARQQLKKFCTKAVSVKRLQGLFAREAPSLFVIADTHGADLHREMRKLGANFCVFEVYKSVGGRYVYRTSGEYPVTPEEEAHCRVHPSFPNMLQVVGAFEFKKTRRGVVNIAFDELLTRWSVLRDGGKQYIQFLGASNPLSPAATYRLLRDKSNRYYFKRN